MSTSLSPVALALGRIPTGLYIVTTSRDGSPLGFVGSFLMQVGFVPPTVCVAIAHDREHLSAIREYGRFAVSILGKDSQKLMGPFFKRHEPGKSAFDHVEHSETSSGLARLDGALAWLDCKLQGEHETGDHVVVFGTVEEGGLQGEGDPAVHLRQNGLGY